MKTETSGFAGGVREIVENLKGMPKVMKQLGLVQFFSWFAFFTMWSFATPALTEHVFQAPLPEEGVANYEALNAAYNEAANQVSSSMGNYGLSSMAFALLLSLYTASRQINRKWIHLISLLIGGAGFLSMTLLTPETSGWLAASFVMIGVAWGSILSMPYAMLSGAIPEDKMGVYMGIFNMFIVLPQILAALGLANWAYKALLGGETIQTMTLAGLCLVLAGVSNLLIRDRKVMGLVD
jgi:maltose/moltooligosaccharide transporter